MKYLVDTLGLPPEELLLTGNRAGVFFEKSTLKAEINNLKTIDYFSKKLEERIPDADFREFISMFLQWRPSDRITPVDALRHKWIRDGMPAHLKNADVFYNE